MTKSVMCTSAPGVNPTTNSSAVFGGKTELVLLKKKGVPCSFPSFLLFLPDNTLPVQLASIAPLKT